MCQLNVRLKYLQLTFFNRWIEVLPALRTERIETEQVHDEIVRRHRLKRIGKAVLLALVNHTEEEKTAREKEAFKQKMRSKVGVWL